MGGSDDDDDIHDNDGDDDDDDKKNNFNKDKKVGNGKGKGKSAYTVQDCLEKFVEKEQMAPEETFYCRYNTDYRTRIPYYNIVL